MYPDFSSNFQIACQYVTVEQVLLRTKLQIAWQEKKNPSEVPLFHLLLVIICTTDTPNRLPKVIRILGLEKNSISNGKLRHNIQKIDIRYLILYFD